MARYFIEVAYKGTRYSGFQTQENAVTIQDEVERAFRTLHRLPVTLTGSSRTDAGVHAFQNFFHFDFDPTVHPQAVYKLNAILPNDIVIQNIYPMPPEAHSRFDASSREYVYKIHRFKNPFLTETSLYYPYKLDMHTLQEGASFLRTQNDFFAFCKTNSQVKTFECIIKRSEWTEKDEAITYTVDANRFLRGMVRLLTATLLKLGRGKITMQEFKAMFLNKAKSGSSVPAHGLHLNRVVYPENYFPLSPLRFKGL